MKTLTPSFSLLAEWGRTAWSILQEAGRRFSKKRGAEAAASLAYYALFSLFPLLLLIVGAASVIFQGQVRQEQLLQYLSQALPVSTQALTQIIQRVLEIRGAFNLIALAGLFWSASGVFSTLALNVNRAFPQSQSRNPLLRRLMAIGMVAVLLGLVFFSLVATTTLDLIASELFPQASSLWSLVTRWTPVVVRLALLWAIYRWVPTTHVPGWAAFWGALAAAIIWELATAGFIYYLASGFARYEVVYGSLGTIVALLVWIYLSGYILLFGAHLTAAIARRLIHPLSQ